LLIPLQFEEWVAGAQNMKAAEFIEICSLNFKLDLAAMTIQTRPQSELTLMGFGWDEGHEWYSQFPAEPLLAEVERCLRNGIKKSRIVVEGTEHDYRIELDGCCGGRAPGGDSERAVRAEIAIDIAKKVVTLSSPG
jgi:hypothetical protein